MSQSQQHQVSIIGTPGSKHKVYENKNSAATCSPMPRTISASSHVSHVSQERTSPEGRSCGDVEQDSQDDLKTHDVSVDVNDDNDSTKYEDCSYQSRRGLDSVSSYRNYETPTEDEYKCAEELFAEVGIKYIDGDETGDEHVHDDTSASSFSSTTYQTPSSTDSDKVSKRSRKDKPKQVDFASLDKSDLSGKHHQLK